MPSRLPHEPPAKAVEHGGQAGHGYARRIPAVDPHEIPPSGWAGRLDQFDRQAAPGSAVGD